MQKIQTRKKRSCELPLAFPTDGPKTEGRAAASCVLSDRSCELTPANLPET